MKRLMAVLGLALLGLLSLPPATAAADSDDWNVSRYAVTAEAAKTGEISVTIDFDFDFADEPGHGPYVTLPIRQAIEGDPDHYRGYDITDVTASSPSGAPDEVQTETESGALAVRIGDEDQEVEGVQTYVLSYRISGIVNPKVGGQGQDEIFWNIIGQQWEVPLRDITVKLTGPGAVVRSDCFVGSAGSDFPCEQNEASGDSVTYREDVVDAGSGMTIVAAWPAGTFLGAEPRLIKRHTVGNVLELTPVTAGVAGLVTLAGAGALLRQARRKGRDEEYLGLTPGVTPAAGTMASTGPRDRRTTVTVRFTPPDHVGPGELGTLVDEKADTRDVTATLVDLAVRGHLRVEEIPEAESNSDDRDWRLVKLNNPTGLRPYEQTLFDGVFADGEVLALGELTGSFSETLAETQKGLYADVTERGWFRANPATVRSRWYLIGAGLVAAGVALIFALGLTLGWGLLGIGIAVVGVVALIVAGRMPARTADGTAVLTQLFGFKQYLKTAEADQIQFEEGEDLFSAYLPFAIAFGVADRWAKVFADLAAQGRNVPDPTWYVGAHSTGYFAAASAGAFTDSLTSFSDAATSSMTAATAGASGGSGFAGGGVGAGVGGGGGGGW